MINEQETISDIVAEMRRLNPENFLSTPWYCEPLPNKMRSYADRIEEAVKRERGAAEMSAQIEGLRRRIGDLQGEIKTLKAKIAGQRAAIRSLQGKAVA